MNCNFPHLFTPLKFGALVSKNRIFSAPMGGGSGADGHLSAEGILTYEELARGGVGVVCLGEALVHSKTGNNHGSVMRLDDPGVIPSLRKCTDGIHRHGALASIEILHPGRRADPIYNADGKTYGPSGGMAHYGDGEHYVTELDEEMIGVLVNSFGDAAEIAMLSGFDMVTVQGAHGWLLTQFLSPNTNWRTDRFGGSIENRGRIFVMIAENIREKCGPSFGIDFRISGSDFMDNGATLDDVIEVAKMLDGKADMLHISAASFDNKRASIRMFPCMFYERGCNAFLAEEIKKHVSIPVVTVGGFADPAQMERLVAEGRVDAIALGRALLADGMLPEKARTGREDDIMFCTRCNECMSLNFVPYVKYPLGGAHCAVNPYQGLPQKTANPVIRRGREKVLVVGAGPAGMEAALGAAECGHDVTLAEKSDGFGGMLKAAWHPEFKKDVKRFVEVLARRIAKFSNIKVEFNTAVTPEYIKKMAPDAVVIAIGAEPIVPDIPGADGKNVIPATRIHERELDQRVVFIGGGMVGCEEGLHAAKYEGRDVTIIEVTDTIAKNAPFIHYISILSEFEKLENLRVLTGTSCEAIRDDGVVVRDADGRETFIPADTVVLSAGMRPLADEAWSLYGIGGQSIIVGDCKKPARMNEAVGDGYFAGFNIQKMDPVSGR
ncbi:MAG: NAD(P)/FAD-dependent oxidoreductase [Oscillospiraceae bacterium]|nr:NAD(P)/FAD-dependent oxidoreductase [Oscillospiraceae bacterium]